MLTRSSDSELFQGDLTVEEAVNSCYQLPRNGGNVGSQNFSFRSVSLTKGAYGYCIDHTPAKKLFQSGPQVTAWNCGKAGTQSVVLPSLRPPAMVPRIRRVSAK